MLVAVLKLKPLPNAVSLTVLQINGIPFLLISVRFKLKGGPLPRVRRERREGGGEGRLVGKVDYIPNATLSPSE